LPVVLADGTTPVRGIQHTLIRYRPGETVVTTASGIETFDGNEHGTLDRSSAAGRDVVRRYRGDGLLSARTDPSGATTSFEHDARGRLLRVTDALGRASVIERDTRGLALRQIAADA